MRRVYYTPTGVVERELTQGEVAQAATMGDVEARKEIVRASWPLLTAAQKLEALARLNGIAPW